MINKKSCSVQTLKRLPYYLDFLKNVEDEHVSASSIAQEFNLNEVQVRKDLAAISKHPGRPRKGFDRKLLAQDIEAFLGYSNMEDALIVGVGHLGRALINYRGIADYGFRIVMGFDQREDIDRVGMTPVFSLDKLVGLARRMRIRLGIITVPMDAAQAVCDEMVRAGIKAIWNFSPVILKVPKGVLVQNENMAASLALLSNHLSRTEES